MMMELRKWNCTYMFRYTKKVPTFIGTLFTASLGLEPRTTRLTVAGSTNWAMKQFVSNFRQILSSLGLLSSTAPNIDIQEISSRGIGEFFAFFLKKNIKKRKFGLLAGIAEVFGGQSIWKEKFSKPKSADAKSPLKSARTAVRQTAVVS